MFKYVSMLGHSWRPSLEGLVFFFCFFTFLLHLSDYLSYLNSSVVFSLGRHSSACCAHAQDACWSMWSGVCVPPPPHHGNLPLMFKSRLPIVCMLILSLLLLFCPNVCLIKSVNQGSSHQLLIEQKCIKISTQNNVQPLQLDF